MKSAIQGLYKSLFTESEQWRPGVAGLALPRLQASDKDYLELSFSEDEVSKALSDCCGDKSPGPDGMTMAFLQSNWPTLNGDIMGMFTIFFFHRGSL